MADVRATTTVPVTANFAGLFTPSACAPAVVDNSTGVLYTLKTGDVVVAAGAGGTVTSVSVVTANGVSGSVATATTTPAITLTLGAITPTSEHSSGTTDSTSTTTGTLLTDGGAGIAKNLTAASVVAGNAALGFGVFRAHAAANVNFNIGTGNTATSVRLIALNDAANSTIAAEIQATSLTIRDSAGTTRATFNTNGLDNTPVGIGTPQAATVTIFNANSGGFTGVITASTADLVPITSSGSHAAATKYYSVTNTHTTGAAGVRGVNDSSHFGEFGMGGTGRSDILTDRGYFVQSGGLGVTIGSLQTATDVIDFVVGGLATANIVCEMTGVSSNARYLKITGATSSGNPTIDVSAGNLAITPALVTASTISAGTTINTAGYTVGTLPAGVTGARAYCTDLLLPTFLAVATGGGAVVGPVFYNGANWVSD